MTRRLISLSAAMTALLPLHVGAQELPAPVRTAAACAPVGTSAPAQAPHVIAPEGVARTIFGVGESVAIDRGANDGLSAGQVFVVRRPMHFQGAPRAQNTIGRLHVVDVTATTAIARIDVSCDEMAVGDVVEPPSELTLSPDITRTFVGGTLDLQHAIRVSYGHDRRTAFGDRDFILAQGGEDQGVTAGARYAALRPGSSANAQPIGEAVVINVFPDQSLLRVTAAREAVYTGDVLALRVGATDPNPPFQRSTAVVSPSESASGATAVTDAAPVERDLDDDASRGSQQALTFEEIHFALDRYALRPEALAILDAAVKTLQGSPALRVQIEGHTCNIGTAEYNLALGQKRANAVRDYLVAHGIDQSRLTTVSYGEEKPSHDNSRAATRSLNRRAVLVVNIQR